MKSNEVLVTGGAGFIGSKLAARFAQEGYKVFVIDDLSTGFETNVPSDCEFIPLDLTDSSRFGRIAGIKPKYILHLAGQSSGEISFDDPVNDLRLNSISTLNLLNHFRSFGIHRFGYASSMSVYGDSGINPVDENYKNQPLSCYGISKLASEQYLAVYSKNIPFTSFRMFNVYGPGQDFSNMRQGMVSIYLSQAITNKRIIVKGSLERFRDFIYVDDVTDIWFKSLTNGYFKNSPVNVGTGKKTTVKELLEEISVFFPEINCEVVGNTKGDQYGIYADPRFLLQKIGSSKFTNINEGLQRTIDSIRSNRKLEDL